MDQETSRRFRPQPPAEQEVSAGIWLLSGQNALFAGGLGASSRQTGHVSEINDPAVIERLIRTPSTWAVVGLSNNRARAAYGVAVYLQGIGKSVVPVHPKAEVVHGATGYASLRGIPDDVVVDVVDVFVNADLAGGIVDQAIARRARAVWLQLGVIDHAAARRALEAGLDVVMDRCPAIEGPRILP